MQSHQSTRKRPAPGTSPPTIQPNQQPSFSNLVDVSDPSQLSDEQFLNWGANQSNLGSQDATYTANFPASEWGSVAQYASSDATAPPSGQLVRRNQNQDLMSRTNNSVPIGSVSWNDSGSQSLRAMSRAWEDLDDEADLNRRAADAKKEAQSKRPPKQIPPFIQKLSSFLDAHENTDLIRWALDGNSFIVVDEDEFAKRLIPELFKSDKYASFVRQLNMYGFHKKVGLSDNSMRASEKKSKNPSEYYNPYFKRGRPELLWLIQKSKNEAPVKKSMGKDKNSNDNGDSGDEGRKDELEASNEREKAAESSNEITQVPKTQLAQLQKEVRDLQRSQQHIASVIARLRDDNNQYLRQASAMIAQHERHETSINAILTFLATFYSRNMDASGNIASMFSNSIPSNPSQGNVVDVGDFDNTNFASQFIGKHGRRPLALLPAPDSPTTSRKPIPSAPQNYKSPNNPPTTTTALSPNEHNKQSPQPLKFTKSHQSGREDISDSPNEDIMSVINNLNANVSAEKGQQPLDFNAALKQYELADGKSPLTPEQRQNMLSLMASTSGTNGPAVGESQNQQNSYLSPLLSNREQLDMLQKLQEEQDSKVQDLADRLQPLSPHGSIPGLSLSSGRNSADLTNEQAAHPDQALNEIAPFNFDGPVDMSEYFDDYYFKSPMGGSSTANGGVGPNPNFEDHRDSSNTPNNAIWSTPRGNSIGVRGDQSADYVKSLGHQEHPPHNGHDDYDRGRVFGSVSNSSGAPSPKVNDVEELPEEELVQSPRKKARIDL